MKWIPLVLLFASCDRAYFHSNIGNCITERGFLYSKQSKYKVIKVDTTKYRPIEIENVVTKERDLIKVLDQYKDIDCKIKPQDIKGGW